ncbi:MAG: DUF2807 domain-containing protein, partial [Muribaculaceae bacterium]|nr:DUF2807 domain-containing protein [Muribaculaceae bacterium]
MKKFAILLTVLSFGIIGCSSISEKVKDSNVKKVIYYNNYKEIAKDPGPDKEIKMELGKDISKIANYVSVDINYVPSSIPKVEISGPENVINALNVEEKGVTVRFDVRNDVRRVDFSDVKVTVSLPVLDEISLYGSG